MRTRLRNKRFFPALSKASDAAQGDSRNVKETSDANKAIERDTYAAEKALRINHDELRVPTFTEKVLGKRPAKSESFEYQVGSIEHQMSRDEVQRALDSHNRNFLPQSGQAGKSRMEDEDKDINIATEGLDKKLTIYNIFYAINGKLDMRTDSPVKSLIVQNLASRHFNASLSRKHVSRIKKMHRKIESENIYSTMSAPLSLCRLARLTKQESFAALLSRFTISGRVALDEYKGGTCLSLADTLCTQIKNDLGLNAYVAATQVKENVLTLWPSPRSFHEIANTQALTLLDNDTHTNVVIPYFKDGKKTFLRLDMGVGPDGAIREDFREEEYALLPPEFVIENPGHLAALSARCAYKLNLRDHQTSAAFGIDLLRNLIYFNKAAALTAKSDENNRSLELLQDDTADRPASIQNLRDAKLLIRSAQLIFRLPNAFVEDVMYLLNNRRAYVEEVLIPPAQCLAKCIKERDRATSALLSVDTVGRALLGSDEYDALGARAASHIAEAAKSVETGNAEAASDHYNFAVTELQKVRNQLLALFAVPNKQRINALRHVDRSLLLEFFAAELDSICSSILHALPQFPTEVRLTLQHLGVDNLL